MNEVMKYLSKLTVVLTGFFLSGCVTASPGPSLPPSPDTTPASPIEIERTNKATFWKITPDEQPQKYSSDITTIISQTDLSMGRRDSLVAQALYSISMTRTFDSLSFKGAITSFILEGNSDSQASNFVTPVGFTGRLSSHTLSARISKSNPTQEESECDNIAQTTLNVVQRNIFILPLELKAGQTWTDSTSTFACSGDLPTAGFIIRTLRVVGESEHEGIPVLVLEKNEKTFSKGEGSQGQHRIFIETQGLANGRLIIHRDSGLLLAANTTNKTAISIQSSGRIQHFLQTSTEITQRIQ